MNNTLSHPLLSRQETAALLGVSLRKVDGLRASGELRCIKSGSRTLFRLQDINEYVQRNRTPQIDQDEIPLIKEDGWCSLPIDIAVLLFCLA